MMLPQQLYKLYSEQRLRCLTSLLVLSFTVVLIAISAIPRINAALLLPFCGLLVYQCVTPKTWRNHTSLGLAVLLGFFIAIYQPPGFDYPLLWHSDALYEGGKPFSQYLNTSKALGGYLVVIWTIGILYSSSAKQAAPLAKLLLAPVVGIAVVFAAAHYVFSLEWQPKLPADTGWFIVINLLVTVVSEEAFFRLLIQRPLQERIGKSTKASLLIISFVGLLFALAHLGGSVALFILFLLAGSVYAGVFAYTNNLLAAIAVHFGVNLSHFLLLEYPL